MRLTASKRALFGACQYWALPSTPWGHTGSDAATAGSEAHAAFEALVTGATVAVPEAARRKAEALRPYLTGALTNAVEIHAELSLAWDPSTDRARVLGEGAGRGVYVHASEAEITGTADLVLRRADGSLLVADYKNSVPGKGVDAGAQLRTLALMSARALGADVVDVLTIMVDESSAWGEGADRLDVFALDAEAAMLTRELVAFASDPTVPRPGPWCSDRYCPARASCPATVEALAQLVPAAELTRHRLSTDLTGPEHAAWALTALDLVEEGIKAIKAALRAYADDHDGIPLPDGSTWAGREVTTEKPSLDVPGALSAIRAAGASEAIESSTTWSAIDKAVGKPAGKALREQLAALGAVRTSSYLRYEARKPTRTKFR